MDHHYPKDVQERSSVNGGPSTYTVGGIKYTNIAEKLSPDRLGKIQTAVWKDYPSVMGQLTGAEFSEMINSKCRGFRTRRNNAKRKVADEELPRVLEYPVDGVISDVAGHSAVDSVVEHECS